jgi:hypothetical protein
MSQTKKKVGVVFIIARCQKKPDFFFTIRHVEQPNGLYCPDYSAKYIYNEKRAKEMTQDSISNHPLGANLPSYQGCPHCKRKSYFLCSCGAFTCAEGNETTFTCTACGVYFPSLGTINSISGNSIKN